MIKNVIVVAVMFFGASWAAHTFKGHPAEYVGFDVVLGLVVVGLLTSR